MVSSLIGPDFSQAPIVSFNLVGTQIYIPIPDECNQDTKCSESNIVSLDDESIYNIKNPDYLLIKHLLKTKFRYLDGSDELEAGQIRVEMDVLKIDSYRPADCNSVFRKSEFLDFYFYLVQYEERKMRDPENREKDDKYLIYPQCRDDIKELNYDGSSSWLFAICGYAEVTRPYRTFVTPITNNHVLSIMVSISGFDFGSVELEQQLVAEADQYILDFIKSIRIDYSPETLAEIQRVRGDVTA